LLAAAASVAGSMVIIRPTETRPIARMLPSLVAHSRYARFTSKSLANLGPQRIDAKCRQQTYFIRYRIGGDQSAGVPAALA
jgi:hypothetical protein